MSNKGINKKTISNLIYARAINFGYNKNTLIQNLDTILNYADIGKDAGMIETLRGKGAYIAAVPDKIKNEEVIRKVTNQLKEDCMELIYQGMKQEEIVHLIEEILENLQGGEQHV